MPSERVSNNFPRYDIQEVGGCNLSAYGEWVQYKDIETELAQLREQLAKYLHDGCDFHIGCEDHLDHARKNLYFSNIRKEELRAELAAAKATIERVTFLRDILANTEMSNPSPQAIVESLNVALATPEEPHAP